MSRGKKSPHNLEASLRADRTFAGRAALCDWLEESGLEEAASKERRRLRASQNLLEFLIDFNGRKGKKTEHLEPLNDIGVVMEKRHKTFLMRAGCKSVKVATRVRMLRRELIPPTGELPGITFDREPLESFCLKLFDELRVCICGTGARSHEFA